MSGAQSTTTDAFFGGAVNVVQPAKGFRAGTDSILLAASVDRSFKGRALEIGCGAGGALFPAAWRAKDTHFTGLERDTGIAQLARDGVALNGFGGRVEIVQGDAADLPQAWAGQFGLVFSNPPFFADGTIKSPGEGKTAAYLESLPLSDWLAIMLYALRPKGTLILIHRASELARILAALEPQTGEIMVMPVRSFPGTDAKRVIVKARKGLRSGGMRLLGGIDLYTAKGGQRSQLLQDIAMQGKGLNWQ